MEILSPLSRWLGLSERVLPTPSPTSAITGKAQISAGERSSQTPSPTPSTREGQSALLARLHALPPATLKQFIENRLPILEDPRFPLSLARYARESAQPRSETQAAPQRSFPTPSSPPPSFPPPSSLPPSFPTLQEPQLLRDATGLLWRAWSIPIVLEGRLEQLRFYQSLRRASERKAKKSAAPSRRFVFATTFSHTGALEIEAEQDPHRLRVAVRTRAPFLPEERSELRHLFHKLLSALSLSGQILFQTMRVLPMEGLDERANEEGVSYEDFL